VHQNLKMLLAHKGISIKAYSEFLGITEGSIRNKIRGRTEFAFSEVRKTQELLFPEYKQEYIFATEESKPATSKTT
jgi:hypothetical protein